MYAVINRVPYDTSTATCVADSHWHDGRNRLSGGRGSALYRTRKGTYFAVHGSEWCGEADVFEPLTLEEAEALYEALPEKNVSFEEAFPTVEVEDA